LTTLENNPHLTLQNEFSTAYMRQKFVTSSKGYIEPCEVKLPVNSDGDVKTFQYIPIIDLVTAIVSDPGFPSSSQHQRNDEMLRDLKDGAAWENNEFFQENKDALCIILYSDELELENPLGASKGKQKVLNIYMTLAEIPKHLRSKTENYFLVLTVRSRDLKGNENVVYDQLVKDLAKLEEGVPFQDGILKAGVLAHLGDNLEAHSVSGLSTNFSSGNICRLCHLKASFLSVVDPNLFLWIRIRIRL
jgi:hypothetical protein